MNVLYEIEEKLYQKLEEFGKKREIGDSDLERIHMAVGAIKNIDKICMMQEQGSSHDGSWEAQMRGDYARDGYSGKRDAMGRFASRDGESYAGGGYSGRRYSRDSYHGGGKLKDELEEMYSRAKSEPEREAIRHFMEMLKS